MRDVWVMEVLSELRRYARQQHLRELEAVLTQASHVAALELSNVISELPVRDDAGPAE